MTTKRGNTKICDFWVISLCTLVLPGVIFYFLRNSVGNHLALGTILSLALFTLPCAHCYLRGWAVRAGTVILCVLFVPFLIYELGLIAYLGAWGLSVWLAFLLVYLRKWWAIKTAP